MEEAFFGKFVKKLPIVIITLYLLVTMCLYAFGPIKYTPNHPFLLYTYLLISVLMLYIGFKYGIKKITSSANIKNLLSIVKTNNDKERKLVRIFKFVLIIYLILIPLTLYSRTGSYIFNFQSFKDLGEAYNSRVTLVTSNGRSMIEWARIILSPVIITYIPLGFICWKNIGKITKLLFILGFIGFVFIDLTCGTNKSLADAIIYSIVFGMVVIIKSISKMDISIQRIKLKKKVWNIMIIGCLALIVFFIFFSSNILSRIGSKTNDYKTAYKYFASYLTQGYRAVDYSFDQPFESTFGFGSSMYLLDSTSEWFHTDYFLNRSYVIKNQNTFRLDYKLSWSSFYVWMANDISLLGVLLLMYLIGYIFGNAWGNILVSMEFKSIIIFGLISQLCFYIPANNQIVQTPEALFGTAVWFLLWFLRSKRKRSVTL